MSFDRIIQGLGSGLGVTPTPLSIAAGVFQIIRGVDTISKALVAYDSERSGFNDKLRENIRKGEEASKRRRAREAEARQNSCKQYSAPIENQSSQDIVLRSNQDYVEIEGYTHPDSGEPYRYPKWLQ